MMLMVPGVYTGYVVALGWISNTLPRPPAKRAAALAAINAVSNTSSIYSSYMYNQKDSPRYGGSLIMRSYLVRRANTARSRCHDRQLRHRLYRHLLRYAPQNYSGAIEQEIGPG